MTEKKKVKAMATAVRQMIIRDVGKYGGTHGVNKLFHLMNAIDHLLAHLDYDYVVKEFNKEIERLKKVEEETKSKTIYQSVKNWNNMQKILSTLRPRLGEIQFAYSRMGVAKSGEKSKYESRYERLCSKVTPYQPEMYFFFNLLAEISDFQSQTIPTQAWETEDISRYIKTPFVKPRRVAEGVPFVSSQDVGRE